MGGRVGIFEEGALEGIFEERRAGGEGGLGTGSGVDLARSSSGQTVRGDPFLARVHSTKAAKSSRGPTSDNSALHAVFRLESLNAQRALSW